MDGSSAKPVVTVKKIQMSEPLSKEKIDSVLAAREKLWRRANLSWKLDANQKVCYGTYKTSKEKINVWNLARGSGKSYTLCVLAIEECLRNPKALVKYCCPKQKDATEIIRPLFRDILEDCPKDIKPEWIKGEGCYRFPNGARLQVSGLDGGKAESLRGGSVVLAIVDEAGDKRLMKDLKYIINSILLPCVTRTKEINGKIILASTPPLSASHPYVGFLRQAELKGASITRTIYTNPRMTQEMLNDIIAGCGGVQSTDFRREYLAEIITDAASAVVPEFTMEMQERLVREWEMPPFYDAYVSMDIGFKDMTAVLFAYYDFRKDKVVVVDEFITRGMTTKVIAEAVSSKEREQFTHKQSGEFREPYKRISDNNLIVIQDLYKLHNLIFIPTKKDDKEAAVNNFRMLVAAEKLIIHPRCKTLIRHIRDAIWKSPGKMAHSSVDDSHYDACFLPDSDVITSTGIKKIKDIVPGDLVLTHKGNFKPVKELLCRDYSGEILEIKPRGRPSIFCTPDHKFWSCELKRTSNKFLTGQLKAGSFSWQRADELTVAANFRKKSGVLVPVIEANKNLPISKEMCFLYGYYVAEGSLGGNEHQIQFSGHIKEKNVIGILEEAIINTYGFGKSGTSYQTKRRHILGQFKPRKRKAHVHIQEGTNARNIFLSCKELHIELKKLGKSLNKKFPDWIYLLDQEQAFYMACGYLFGDGHFSKDGIVSGSISKDIIYGLELLLNKCGVSGSIRLQKRAGRYKGLSDTGLIKNDQWIHSLDKETSVAIVDKINNTHPLNFIFEDKKIHPIVIKNYQNIESPIKTITQINKWEYTGPVYSMEVEEDHSYTINGIAVKNCDAAIYLVRNIDFGRNPYPANYGIQRTSDYYNLNNNKTPKNVQWLDTMLNLKKRK